MESINCDATPSLEHALNFFTRSPPEALVVQKMKITKTFLFELLKMLPKLKKLRFQWCLIDKDVFQPLCDLDICPKLATLDFGLSNFSDLPRWNTMYEDIFNLVACKSSRKGNKPGETAGSSL